MTARVMGGDVGAGVDAGEAVMVGDPVGGFVWTNVFLANTVKVVVHKDSKLPSS